MKKEKILLNLFKGKTLDLSRLISFHNLALTINCLI
jgi:hypothetical protein